MTKTYLAREGAILSSLPVRHLSLLFCMSAKNLKNWSLFVRLLTNWYLLFMPGQWIMYRFSCVKRVCKMSIAEEKSETARDKARILLLAGESVILEALAMRRARLVSWAL